MRRTSGRSSEEKEANVADERESLFSRLRFWRRKRALVRLTAIQTQPEGVDEAKLIRDLTRKS